MKQIIIIKKQTNKLSSWMVKADPPLNHVGCDAHGKWTKHNPIKASLNPQDEGQIPPLRDVSTPRQPGGLLNVNELLISSGKGIVLLKSAVLPSDQWAYRLGPGHSRSCQLIALHVSDACARVSGVIDFFATLVKLANRRPRIGFAPLSHLITSLVAFLSC